MKEDGRSYILLCATASNDCFGAMLQNSRKGEFSRQRLKGKRAIELGAGMGLGGFAMAMLGAIHALHSAIQGIQSSGPRN